MFDTFAIHRAQQLTLVADPMALADVAGPDPGAEYGEVFTRRWVVDLILDLAGYTPDRDLGSQVLIEPSCGTGAFLGPAVERLIQASTEHGRDLRALGPAIRAFDLLDANAQRARKAAADQLTLAGLSEDEAVALVGEWISTGDFLLQHHELASADYIVGNPPYIRLEDVPQPTMASYRRSCRTMRGRADVYVGFIERGLELLKPGGTLAFICADRWMRNQYGADLREEITRNYAVDAVVSMHGVDAFEEEVAAYPAIVVLQNRRQNAAAVVQAKATFSGRDTERLSSWVREGSCRTEEAPSFTATRVDEWFCGRDPWPSGSPAQLALIGQLEAQFAPLQDAHTGTRVGIGVATGCDEVFITTDPDLVEEDRLLPLLRATDTSSGSVQWSGSYLVNPWNGQGLIDLESVPRMAAYLHEHERGLRARHVARKRPASWYRTIDRVDQRLTVRPKLVLPDLKATAHPVLEGGSYYPHHNLYYVVSEAWDPEVLGGLLLSDIANLFVGAYCVRMRGNTFRFQAQYLRRIRVPAVSAVQGSSARELRRAFNDRDRDRANGVADLLYGLAPNQLADAMRS